MYTEQDLKSSLQALPEILLCIHSKIFFRSVILTSEMYTCGSACIHESEETLDI
jgi:hypothetical protein